MKITRECDYAIRIILMLAGAGEGEITDAQSISERQSIPRQFTLKILRKLLKAGYVKSFKGARGGYCLDAHPKDISLYDVISAIDDNVLINECFSCGYVCSRVENPDDCPVHIRLGEINRLLTDKLSEITFESLINSCK